MARVCLLGRFTLCLALTKQYCMGWRVLRVVPGQGVAPRWRGCSFVQAWLWLAGCRSPASVGECAPALCGCGLPHPAFGESASAIRAAAAPPFRSCTARLSHLGTVLIVPVCCLSFSVHAAVAFWSLLGTSPRWCLSPVACFCSPGRRAWILGGP